MELEFKGNGWILNVDKLIANDILKCMECQKKVMKLGYYCDAKKSMLHHECEKKWKRSICHPPSQMQHEHYKILDIIFEDKHSYLPNNFQQLKGGSENGSTGLTKN